jgi:hypothetical protein
MAASNPYPTSAQVSDWEQLLATTYSDHLVEAVLERAISQREWASALALMGTVDPPGGSLSIVLQSYSTWLNSVWLVVEGIIPAYIDLLFPAFVCLQPELTLANAEAVIAGFPRFIASAGAYWDEAGGVITPKKLLTGYVYLVKYGITPQGVDFGPDH